LSGRHLLLREACLLLLDQPLEIHRQLLRVDSRADRLGAAFVNGDRIGQRQQEGAQRRVLAAIVLEIVAGDLAVHVGHQMNWDAVLFGQ